MKRARNNFITFYLGLAVLVSLGLIFINLIQASEEETNLRLKSYLSDKVCPSFAFNNPDNFNELTMKDLCTGLVWARHELPTFKVANDANPGYTWTEADKGCKDLIKVGSKSLFRLPTVEELLTLINYNCSGDNCSAGLASGLVESAPVFSQGIYWTSSDFNEPAGYQNYKRSVSLINSKVDSPIFSQEMKLNVWCIMDRDPEVFENKFTSVSTYTGSQTTQATAGQLQTLYQRICKMEAPTDCSSISGSACQ